MTDLDLFGDPSPPPRKTEIGYLQHLANLTYPAGWRFWAQAGGTIPPGVDPARHDLVWLIDGDGEWHRELIDITTGQIIETERASP